MGYLRHVVYSDVHDGIIGSGAGMKMGIFLPFLEIVFSVLNMRHENLQHASLLI